MVHIFIAIRDKKASLWCLVFLISCIVLWNLFNSQNKSQNNSYLSEVKTFPRIEIYKCKETIEHYGGIKTQICLKPLTVDAWISKKIDDWGSFEGTKVSVVLKAMSMYPKAVFLDIGSNIGMYTVMVAGAGRQVVAVDAMLVNLAYIHHSLTVGNTTQFVRLLNNPVSDKRELLLPVLEDLSNQGATRLVPVHQFTGKDGKAVGPPVTSTTLLDLLNFINTETVIVKMDVEGYECKVLHTYLTNTHPPYYLPYITMEWRNIRENLGSSCPNIEGLVDALYSNNYTGYRLHGNGPDDQGLPGTLEKIDRDKILVDKISDVLWAHKDAPALFW